MAKRRKRGGAKVTVGSAKQHRSHRRRTMILSVVVALSTLGLLAAGLLSGAVGR